MIQNPFCLIVLLKKELVFLFYSSFPIRIVIDLFLAKLLGFATSSTQPTHLISMIANPNKCDDRKFAFIGRTAI